MRFSDKIIAALPAPGRGNRRTPDSEVPGLAVQVSAAGHRAFVLRYRVRQKERQLTIGAFPTWTVMAARHRAKELRRQIDQGIDPLEQEAAAIAEAMTLEDYWNDVYRPLHVVAKRPSWARDIRGMMANDILPVLGRRAIKGIDDADVAALHRRSASARRYGRIEVVPAIAFDGPSPNARISWRAANESRGCARALATPAGISSGTTRKPAGVT